MTKRTLILLACLLLMTQGRIAARAQSVAPLSPIVLQRIENEIRSRYSVPVEVDVTIGTPKPGEYPGYDTIVVAFLHDGKTTSFDFLISQDRKTLARLEKIDISRDLMSQFDTAGRPVRGNVNAPVTIFSFADYECPFCARMHVTLFPNLMRKYGNQVKFIYVDYPLTEIHPWAMHAAINADCLAAQNPTAYWSYVDYLYSNEKTVTGNSPAAAAANLDKAAMEEATRQQLDTVILNDCIKKDDETAVRASMAEGDKLGVDSTPTMFINGLKVEGNQTEAQMRFVLDRAIAKAAASSK